MGIKTQTGRDSHDPFGFYTKSETARDRSLLGGFLFLLNLNNFAAVVETAFRADGMRKAHGTAVGTGNGVHRCQRIL